MLTKVIWMSMVAVALARSPIADDDLAIPLESEEVRQRNARSIWPFVSSEPATEPPVINPPPLTPNDQWFVQGETALPEGIDLSKYPVWRVHKYHGIDLRPVQLQPVYPYPQEERATQHSSGSSSSSDFDQYPREDETPSHQSEPVVYPPEMLTYQTGEQGSNYFRDSVNNKFNVQSQQNQPAYTAPRITENDPRKVQQAPQIPHVTYGIPENYRPTVTDFRSQGVPDQEQRFPLLADQKPNFVRTEDQRPAVTRPSPNFPRVETQEQRFQGTGSQNQNFPRVEGDRKMTSRTGANRDQMNFAMRPEASPAKETARGQPSSMTGGSADLSFLDDLGGLASFLPDQPAPRTEKPKASAESKTDLSFLNDLGGLAGFLPEPKSEDKTPQASQTVQVAQPQPGFFQNFLSRFTGSTPTVASPEVPAPEVSTGYLPSIFGQPQTRVPEITASGPPQPPSGLLSSLFYRPEVPQVPKPTIFLPQTRGSYVAVKLPRNVIVATPQGYEPLEDVSNIAIHEAPRVPFNSHEIPTISSPTLDFGYHNGAEDFGFSHAPADSGFQYPSGGLEYVTGPVSQPEATFAPQFGYDPSGELVPSTDLYSTHDFNQHQQLTGFAGPGDQILEDVSRSAFEESVPVEQPGFASAVQPPPPPFEVHPAHSAFETQSTPEDLSVFSVPDPQQQFEAEVHRQNPGLEDNFVGPLPGNANGFVPSRAFEFHISANDDQPDYRTTVGQHQPQAFPDFQNFQTPEVPTPPSTFYANLPAPDAYLPQSFRRPAGVPFHQDDARFVQNLSDLTSYGTPTNTYSSDPFATSASSETRKVVSFQEGTSPDRDRQEQLTDLENDNQDESTGQTSNYRKVLRRRNLSIGDVSDEMPVTRPQTASLPRLGEMQSIMESREGRLVDGTKVIDGYSKVKWQQHPATDLPIENTEESVDSAEPPLPNNHKY